MPTLTEKMYKTRNDLPVEVRENVIRILNQQLADTSDLYSQTKQAHWNVKGRDFYQLHELYDELAEVVEGFIDLIAERATALGGVAAGTIRMAARSSRLPEYPAEADESMANVQAMADRYANIAASTRAAIEDVTRAGDADTADLLTDISRGLDKSLWFLEAHLQR